MHTSQTGEKAACNQLLLSHSVERGLLQPPAPPPSSCPHSLASVSCDKRTTRTSSCEKPTQTHVHERERERERLLLITIPDDGDVDASRESLDHGGVPGLVLHDQQLVRGQDPRRRLVLGSVACLFPSLFSAQFSSEFGGVCICARSMYAQSS